MSFDIDKLGALVFELAPCAVAVIDRDYNIVAANDSAAEGYGRWEGRHCYEVFKRRHRPCTRCAAMKTFEDGEVHQTEERGFDKDGRHTHFVVKTAPLRGADGQVEHVVEMSLDISSYRQLESRHRLLFERVPCFVTMVDRDLRIVDANWRHEETFGDARGRHCYETYMKADRQCADCPTRRTFADGRVHTHQQRALDKKGNEVHFVVHSAPVQDEFGEIAHVIEMATDITPLVEVQRQLLVAEGEASLNKAMGMLAHSVDQLHGPLDRLAAELRRGIAEQDAAALERACGRLEDRTRYLQALRVVLAGQRGAASARDEIAPGDVVARVVAGFTGRTTTPRIAVRGAAPDGLPVIHGDAALLEACLGCLVSDYIAFNAPRGAEDSPHQVLLSAAAQPAGVVFEVRYRGVRLVDEGEPEASGLTGHPGAAMSLAVVRHAIESFGGQISFGAEAGQGIAIRVELPVAV